MFSKEYEKLKILNKKYKHIIELNAPNEDEEEEAEDSFELYESDGDEMEEEQAGKNFWVKRH